jgi:hypothetical protein
MPCPKCKQSLQVIVSADSEAPQVLRDLGGAPTRAADTHVPADGMPVASFAASFQLAEPTTAFHAVVGPDQGGALPDRLGGYLVRQQLGHGGMGVVYLGWQVSLSRAVALKVMNPQLARDPDFVARFTREAYAAAQLVHHNIVQIYDIGAEGDLHYYSMEYVTGQSLLALVQRDGKLDVEQALGYVLQAARGLKFGHDVGMIHRDIKPDNLLLNEQGIVKVSDLGLVKLPHMVNETAGAASPGTAAGSGEETPHGVMLGTPKYMSPEQARDPAKVGVASDVYSLGCTLYVLLTGKAPFEGKSTQELAAKHAAAPVVRPELIAKRVPKALSDILLRMMAKKPEERYPNMGAVIEVLENFLGIARVGPFTPREEHAATLEHCVREFNEAPSAKLRWYCVLGFSATIALFLVLCAFLGQPLLACGIFGLGLLAPLCYFLVHGQARKTPLFLKAREWLLGNSRNDWLTLLGLVAVGLLVLYLFGLLWVWLFFCLLGAGLALGLYFGLDRRIAAERDPVLAKAERLFRKMRVQGLEEEVLRRFACKYSGPRWEEFYETLFGYEAKLKARDWSLGESGKMREKFAALREPIIAWFDAQQQARREARERKYIQAVEAKALQAKGLSAQAAQEQAERVAREMVRVASGFRAALTFSGRTSGSLIAVAFRAVGSWIAAWWRARQEARATARAAAVPAPPPKPKVAAAATPEIPPVTAAQIKELVAAASRPAPPPRPHRMPRFIPFLGECVEWLFAPRMRFLSGMLLLAGCVAWLYQYNSLGIAQIQWLVGTQLTLANMGAEPLPTFQVPGVPEVATAWFSTLHAGVAGLLLLISSRFGGALVSLLVAPGVIVILIGPFVRGWLGPEILGELNLSTACLAMGVLLVMTGFVLLRR